jgi:phosphoglycolate phosphatase-like HAD superfamily hydrolase
LPLDLRRWDFFESVAIDLVVLDFGGTLLPRLDMHIESTRMAVNAVLDRKITKSEDLIIRMGFIDGLPTSEILSRAIRDADSLVSEIVCTKRHIMDARLVSAILPMRSKLRLQYLSARFKIAIVSMGSTSVISAVLTNSGFRADLCPTYGRQLSSDTVNKAELLKSALGSASLDKVVYLGDTAEDERAAAKCGVAYRRLTAT